MDLRASSDAPLASHAPGIAAQEVVALLLARTRLRVGEATEVALLRASFIHTLAGLQPL